MKQLVITILMGVLVACSPATSAVAPTSAPLVTPLPSPPDQDVLAHTTLPELRPLLLASGVPDSGFQTQHEADRITLGRLSRAALLPWTAIAAYEPGQSVRSLVQPTELWMVPVLLGSDLKAIAMIDQHGHPIDIQWLSGTPSEPPLLLTSAYTDLSAEVWLIDVPTISRQALLVRGTQEHLTFLFQGPTPLLYVVAALY